MGDGNKKESKQNSTKKVGKYLTDLKELFTEQRGEEVVKKEKPRTKEDLSNDRSKVEEQVVDMQNKVPAKENKLEKIESVDVINDVIDKPYSTKDVILGVINFLSVILLIFLLVKLPQKSDELKSLRIEEIKDMQLIGYSSPNLNESKSKSDALQSLFLDNSGVVSFAEDIETLKSTNSAIQKVTFTSQKPIKDKLGLSGIPVIVLLEGSWEEIGSSMNAIEKLAYLFRPAILRAEISVEEPNVVTLEYGGMLYVGDGFTKN